MSNRYYFMIVPFDWRVENPSKSEISLDMDDIAHHFKVLCPCGEVMVVNHEGLREVRLYITLTNGDPWVACSLTLEKWTILEVSDYPKTLAVQIMAWYRRYIDASQQLYVIVLFDGVPVDYLGGELRVDMSLEAIENFFPHDSHDTTWFGC